MARFNSSSSSSSTTAAPGAEAADEAGAGLAAAAAGLLDGCREGAHAADVLAGAAERAEGESACASLLSSSTREIVTRGFGGEPPFFTGVPGAACSDEIEEGGDEGEAAEVPCGTSANVSVS